MEYDPTPQMMLFGIAIDLALLSIILMRERKGTEFPYLLAMVLVLGMGAICGFLQVDIYSVKVRPLLVVYELLLPAVFWVQLVRLSHGKDSIWVPVPVVAVVGGLAFMSGWEFQCFELLVYELVFLLVITVIVSVRTLTGPFAEGEGFYLLAGLAVLLVMGPGYGLVWTDIGFHYKTFAIVGGGAGALVLAGKVMNPFLQFRIRASGPVEGSLRSGIHMVPPELMNEAMKAFMRDVKGGRNGLYISMEPVAKVLGRWGQKGEGATPERPNLFAAQLTHSLFLENSLDPSNSDILGRTLAEFFKRSNGGAVMVRDGHYLVSNTDVWELTEVLGFLEDRMGEDGTLLIGTELLDDWETSHLEKTGVGTLTRADLRGKGMKRKDLAQ
jgi:hypothetical protein